MFKGAILTIVVMSISGLNFGVSIYSAQAAIPTTYTNSNFLDTQHDKPLSFTQDANGNFSGVTETGKIFQQYSIVNSLSIRLQRFSIDQAFFYISDRGIILADNDTVALSIYLTKLV